MSEHGTSHSSSDIAHTRPLVVVPIGAFEQHGPHLPLDTDTRIARAVAERAIARASTAGMSIVEAPAVPISASDEHRDFPGTLSIGTDNCAHVLVAIARSATWARGVIFVNGHGGNADALTRATSQLVQEGLRHKTWSVSGFAADDTHAGHAETSLLLHIAPTEVRLDRLVHGNTSPLSELLPTMRDHGVRAVSPSGVLGDPRQANADFGKALLRDNVDALFTVIQQCNAQWR